MPTNLTNPRNSTIGDINSGPAGITGGSMNGGYGLGTNIGTNNHATLSHQGSVDYSKVIKTLKKNNSEFLLIGNNSSAREYSDGNNFKNVK